MSTITHHGIAAPRPLQVAARAGLVARGGVYVVVAALALTVARQGDAQQDADTVGALAAVGQQPYGRALLWVLAVGLAGYAAWRATQAVTGRTTTRETAGAAIRVGAALRALTYAALAVAAAQVAIGAGADSGAQQQQSWTATVLGWPGGPAVVAAIGGALVVLGAVEAVNGTTGRFMRRLQDGRLGQVRVGLVRTAGAVGHTGRGIAYALIGGFVVQAALREDPSKSRGLDGALAELVRRPYGPWALLALAAALLVFGLYSITEARWRRIRA